MATKDQRLYAAALTGHGTLRGGRLVASKIFLTMIDIRFGSLPDIEAGAWDVRFAPKSEHAQSWQRCRLSARSRLAALDRTRMPGAVSRFNCANLLAI